ncbi:MAG: InlB B-repeat-containing protein, partial [Oscillospiraceae bacterium]|nr:InlB B-repeat-containing protein [Oscillospiraceae bacterium]
MKKFRKVVSLVMLLCITMTLLPPLQFARAAQVATRYELDTDGIDPGATYLIVNTATAGTANVLNFYYGNTNTNRKFLNQTTLVETDKDGTVYIATGFTDEADCQFQFAGSSSGKITHGDYGIDLRNGRYTTSSSANNITYTTVGGGAYRLSYRFIYTYYLRWSGSAWESYRSGTANVYLFKLVEYEVGHNVTFDGNGYTSGKLPANREMLESGSTYTIPYPEEELRKDIGLDTWLFLCWNTKPDGSGTEYAPGTQITLTEDLTLYADWYEQTKYTVTMATELDGVRTDVSKISGQDKSFAIKKDGGDYIPLQRSEEGTYITKVVENGDYIVYSHIGDGEYEAVHGHMVTIYNQDGTTVCQHFTVNYDTQGGTWAEGQNPGQQICHALDTVTLTENVPTLAGNRFLHWVDQHGNIYPAGAQVTNILEKITLTAVWEETIDVTITVVVDHNSADGGHNNAADRNDLLLQILRVEHDINLPLDQIELTSQEDSDKITYTIELKDQPQGIYHVAAGKSGYETTFTYQGAANEDQQIFVNLEYAPSNFDLTFDVNVHMDPGEEALKPTAVNVKVIYWGYKNN